MCCFKDLMLGTSFFRIIPIVIPFWKALGSEVLMAPRYRPKNQWLITSHHKQAKNYFSVPTPIFFLAMAEGCIRGHMVYLIEQAPEH